MKVTEPRSLRSKRRPRRFNQARVLAGPTAIVIDTRTMGIVSQFQTAGEADPNYAVTITNDGQKIVVGNTSSLRVYASDGSLVRDLNARGVALALQPANDRIVAAGSLFGRVGVWNIETGQVVIPAWGAHTKTITRLQYNQSDGTRLMSHDWLEDTIRVWDASGHQVGATINFSGNDATISPDGTQIASNPSGGGRTISVFDVTSGSRFQTLEYEFSSSVRLRYAATGKTLLSGNYGPYMAEGCKDYEILTWDVASSSLLARPFEGHTTPYGFGDQNLASGESDELVVSTSDRQVIVWDRTTARVIRRREFPGAMLDVAGFSPDGRYAVLLGYFPNLVQSTQGVVATAIAKPRCCGTDDEQSNERSRLVHPIRYRSLVRQSGSNLPDVTNQVLVDAVAAGVPAPACVSIGQYTFLEALRDALNQALAAEYPIPGQATLVFHVCLSHTEPVDLVVDPVAQHIRVTLPLFIDVIGYAEPDLSFRLARIRVTFSLVVTPSIVTTTDQRLQLDLQSASLVRPADVHIIDPEAVLGAFGQNFVQFIETQIEEVLNTAASGIGLLLPSVLASIPLPDPWKQAREYELVFRQFVYRPVDVQADDPADSAEYGYLFLLFSLVSHNYPPPCICGDAPGFRSEVRRAAEADPRRWFSLGLSEGALNVLANPHRNAGNRSGRSEGKRLYWAVEGFFSSQIGQILIANDRVFAPVTVSAGGSARAGLRDFLNNDLARISVSLSVTVTDVQTYWEVGLRNDPDNDQVTNLYLRPTVLVAPQNVDVDFSSPFPDELDVVVEYILDWFATAFITLVELGVQRLAFMELVYDVLNTQERDFNIGVVQNQLFERSSLVLIGDLTLHRPG